MRPKPVSPVDARIEELFAESDRDMLRIGTFASGMTGPIARDNASIDKYLATISVDEMHASAREYAYQLESEFGIVDHIVLEHAAQLCSELFADNVSFLREKFRALCNRVSVVREEHNKRLAAEQHARDEASRLATMKWFHDYAIREAARTSAESLSTSALPLTSGGFVTAAPAPMTGVVPAVSGAPTSIASLVAVSTVAFTSTALAGGTAGVTQLVGSGSVSRPDQYLSRLLSEGCIMSRPHPTAAFDPFARTSGLWPAAGAHAPPPAPVVHRTPDLSLIEALSPEFLQSYSQAQIDVLRPVLQPALPEPDVSVESESERRLSALSACFPESIEGRPSPTSQYVDHSNLTSETVVQRRNTAFEYVDTLSPTSESVSELQNPTFRYFDPPILTSECAELHQSPTLESIDLRRNATSECVALANPTSESVDERRSPTAQYVGRANLPSESVVQRRNLTSEYVDPSRPTSESVGERRTPTFRCFEPPILTSESADRRRNPTFEYVGRPIPTSEKV